jgi:hypothetical protein
MTGEIAAPPFAFDFSTAYRADGWAAGIAWRAYAYESEPDEDTEWTGYNVPTGRILAHMIGDDESFAFEPEELQPIGGDDYCSGCGQIGCGHG